MNHASKTKLVPLLFVSVIKRKEVENYSKSMVPYRLTFLFISFSLVQGSWDTLDEEFTDELFDNDSNCTVRQETQLNLGNTLPPRFLEESLSSYVRRVFANKNEKADNYFVRIFKQYDKESNESYVKRIDTIFSQFPSLACKHNTRYWCTIQKYYKLKYGSIQNLYPKLHEHEDGYFKRILQKEKNEDFKSYIKRLDCVYQAYPKLNIWRKIKFSEDSKTWYVYRERTSDQDSCYSSNIRPSLNVCESITKKYARRKSEEGDDFTYFQRICKRKTGEPDLEYVRRITNIKEKFGDLPLWYEVEYAELTKDYYSLVYRKKDSESLDDYYRRITWKDDSEDLKTFVKRLSLLENLFCSLPIWNNKNYLQFTETYYRALYARELTEDDMKYIQRVTERSSCESVEEYKKRMEIVRWVCRDTDFFSNKKYFNYTKFS